MDDKEKIQSFGDMVNATEKLSRPWQEQSKRMTWALILTNLFWALVLVVFIAFAYLTPETTYQEQDFTNNTQYQQSGYPASFDGANGD